MVSGGEDFFKDSNDDFSSGPKRSSLRPLNPNRIASLEDVFMQVVGRKPSSRELAYYKYSNLSDDDIRSKLLDSDEHKKILDKASKLNGVKDQLSDSQLNEKKLKQSVDDLNRQIEEVRNLFAEKNHIIEELRDELKNPYNLVDYRSRFEEGFDVFTTPHIKKEIPEKKSFGNILKEFIDLIIK